MLSISTGHFHCNSCGRCVINTYKVYRIQNTEGRIHIMRDLAPETNLLIYSFFSSGNNSLAEEVVCNLICRLL